MDQVGGVLQQDAALFQRLGYQRDIALLQITHAPMHEFGGTARSALPKIALLDQHHIIPARRGIQGGADAGCAATDNGDIPGFFPFQETFEKLVAPHKNNASMMDQDRAWFILRVIFLPSHEPVAGLRPSGCDGA